MQVEKHPSLYHADGDIILSAKGPELHQLFRVHKVFLAHYSDVFKDMFQLGAEVPADETYDGVPMVTMPDNAEDLTTLLEVLYKPA